MTIGERIFILRTIDGINLNQEKFGGRINLSKFAISGFENGKRPVTDRVIMDICRVFKVSERWLRTGEGEMFAKTDDSLIAKLSAEYNLSETEQKILNIYLHLDESRRNQLVNFAVYFANEISTSESNVNRLRKKQG